MPAGGARARSGPAADPNAIRRDRDNAQWQHIDPSPVADEPPIWPLPTATAWEKKLWAHEWARPQARLWLQLDLVMEVAVYVRSVRIAVGAKGTASDRKLVQSQADRLGLTVSGMRFNRWIIDGEQPAATPVRNDDPDRAALKKQFATIEGGRAAG